jgi:hypothetical protein
MPEVVAMVRQGCPAALRIQPWQVEGLVSEVMGRETPPPTRGKKTVDGARSEIEARIANALDKVKNVKLTAFGDAVQLSIDGAQIKGTVAGVKVVGKGDLSGPSVEASKGDVSLKAQGAYAGDSFGVTTKVDEVSFGAKIEKENGAWTKWSMTLTIPVVGGAAKAVPPADQLRDAVIKADAAIARVVAHLQSGGSPTDDVVKEALADIKPAIDAVGKATAKAKSGSVTITGTASGSSSGWSFGVGLVVTF